MVPLQVTAILFAGLGAAVVALARDIVRQALLFSMYGFALVVLFVVYQAPDVALSALVVSSIAYPLVLVGAIARVEARRKRKGE
jgi:multisubunit Na+/H+ antiporter MnhB subunit